MLSLKITTETSTCAQDGVTWFGFTLLPETTKTPDKVCETVTLKI